MLWSRGFRAWMLEFRVLGFRCWGLGLGGHSCYGLIRAYEGL